MEVIQEAAPLWHLTRPDQAAIRAFLEVQRALPYSYPEVGHSLDRAPPGYDNDHNRQLLGRGEGAFRAACDAIRAFRMFPGTWVLIEPKGAPIEKDQVLAMVARAFGVWWVNACRIVYVLDEKEPVRRFGFAYGTLPAHVERGEERFSVEWRDDDTVWYDLRAFSRPRYWAVRLGYPIARTLQRRFVRESKLAMQRAVASG